MSNNQNLWNKIYVYKHLSEDQWQMLFLCSYSFPVLGNEIVWGVGFTMYSVIMGHLGSDAVAANSITNIVKNLVACFCLGLGSGGGIMVGNELGAGRMDKAKEYGGRLCRMSILCGVASGIVMLALSQLIFAVRTSMLNCSTSSMDSTA